MCVDILDWPKPGRTVPGSWQHSGKECGGGQQPRTRTLNQRSWNWLQRLGPDKAKPSRSAVDPGVRLAAATGLIAQLPQLGGLNARGIAAGRDGSPTGQRPGRAYDKFGLVAPPCAQSPLHDKHERLSANFHTPVPRGQTHKGCAYQATSHRQADSSFGTRCPVIKCHAAKARCPWFRAQATMPLPWWGKPDFGDTLTMVLLTADDCAGSSAALELECESVPQSRNNPTATTVRLAKPVHIGQPHPAFAAGGIKD